MFQVDGIIVATTAVSCSYDEQEQDNQRSTSRDPAIRHSSLYISASIDSHGGNGLACTDLAVESGGSGERPAIAGETARLKPIVSRTTMRPVRLQISFAVVAVVLFAFFPRHAVGQSISFTDVTAAAQITHTHGYASAGMNDERTLCGGVAAGDFDADGYTDLYVIRGDSGPNLLYRNLHDGRFEDVAEAAGVDVTMQACSATFADYDGDGWLDLLVLGFEETPSILFRNLGTNASNQVTFEDVTESSGLTLTRKNSISASFGDYDRDGDLDAFVTHWQPRKVEGIADQHLWRNEGDGTFTDVGRSIGIMILPDGTFNGDFSFSPNFSDINSDGWPDLLVSADFGKTRMFLNDGDGTFTDVTNPLVITDQNGMGTAVADFDRDGDLDWFVTSIYLQAIEKNGNRLYRNLGNGVFEDATEETGVRIGDWGWGATFQDFDNDANVDLVHVNGYDADISNIPGFETDPAKLFISDGMGGFTDQAASRGIADTGRGLGVVAFDYDRDGDLDVFITNNQSSPKLYRNDGGNAKHFLTVVLQGQPPNTEGIGSRVLVTAGGLTQMQELRSGSNYISQDPAELHFGLGEATTVEQVEVQWFLGGSTTLSDVAVDQRIVVVEPLNTCGDGVQDAGEACDLGENNGGPGAACLVNCRLRPPTPTVTPTATPTATPTPTLLMLDGEILYYNGDRAVPEVAVWRSNGMGDVANTTDPTGRYVFAGLSSEPLTFKPEKVGGFHEGISSLDASWALQAAVGLRVLDANQKLACDVSGNGVVSSLDATFILQYKVGILDRFHVAETCDSDWVFVPSPLVMPHQSVVPPAIGSGSCTPGRIIFDPLSDNATAQDFRAILFGDCTGNWQPPATGAAQQLVRRMPGATAKLGHPRRLGLQRYAVPILVRSRQPISALDLEIRYDPQNLRVASIRATVDGGLVAWHEESPGEVRVSFATASPLRRRVRRPLLVELEGRALRRVRRWVSSARVSVVGEGE